MSRSNPEYTAPSAEQIEVIKWPQGYPFASVWVVRKTRTGYSPIKELHGVSDPKSDAAQKALAEERRKLFDLQQRSELSESHSD